MIALRYFRIRTIQRNFLFGVALGLVYATAPPNARKTSEGGRHSQQASGSVRKIFCCPDME